MSLFKRQLPGPVEGTSFIYSLMNGDECIYVGQTTSLKRRLCQHFSEGKDFDDVDFFECESLEANTKEVETIIRYQPLLNKSMPVTDKYTTLSVLKNRLLKEIVDINNYALIGVVFPRKPEPLARAQNTYLESDRADKIVTWFIQNLKDY